MPRTAYSYQRCSDPKQAGGDTKRRQREALLNAEVVQYCRRNNLPLDDKHTLSDWGIAAFRGENVRRGALGQFLDAIEKGAIHPGDVLIVEAIDRLTRLPLDAADQLLGGILRAGVSIVTIRPFLELNPSDLNDLGKRMLMLTYCEVAHRSSADKSKWLSSAWSGKRKTAAEKKLTLLCPSWLRLSEDRKRFIEIPEAVKIVKRLFRMALDGQGAHTIIKTLNREGVPPITKSRKRAAVWYESTVSKLLANRAVLGEFQPHAGGHRNSNAIRNIVEKEQNRRRYLRPVSIGGEFEPGAVQADDLPGRPDDGGDSDPTLIEKFRQLLLSRHGGLVLAVFDARLDGVQTKDLAGRPELGSPGRYQIKQAVQGIKDAARAFAQQQDDPAFLREVERLMAAEAATVERRRASAQKRLVAAGR